MKLSKNLTLAEVVRSETAKRIGIDNTPSEEHLENLKTIAKEIFQPIRDHFKKPIHISSGYRSERYIYLGDGTTANRVVIRFSPTINDLRMLVKSGGSTQVSSGTTNYNITNFNKIALKYKQNDFALWVNGVKALVDTNGNTPIGMDELSLSYSGTEFKGNVKDVRVYNNALTDAQLQALTS